MKWTAQPARRRKTAALAASAWVLASLFAPRLARADVSHVVARGHTLEAIAARYHVTVKAIADANHLTPRSTLHPGDTLTIPGVAPAGKGGKPTGKTARVDAKGKSPQGKTKPPTYALKPRTPNVLHVVRIATTESFTIRVVDSRGRMPKDTPKTFERMMRSAGGLAHTIDAKLISLLGKVSNHFGSRPIQVISGFRPYSPTQHTSHSNHNIGRAIDFRVVGVPNEVVRDYLRSLKNVGVGYYPNSSFVHLDVREASAYWIDYSRPGEPPRYNSPNSGADEGTSDVVEDAKFLLYQAPATPKPRLPSDLLGPDTPEATPATPESEGTTSPAAPAAPGGEDQTGQE